MRIALGIEYDGTNYVGQFENDMFSGKGEWLSPDGRKYVGEFQRNTFNGEGTFTLPNGNEFSGAWKDGTLIRQKVEKGADLHSESAFVFPGSLDDMERCDITNYELTQGGMGISVDYIANKVDTNIYIDATI